MDVEDIELPTELSNWDNPEPVEPFQPVIQQPPQTITFNPEYHNADDIGNWIITHPTSFLLVPCSERGLLRLHRGTKRGYWIQFFPSLMDELTLTGLKRR